MKSAGYGTVTKAVMQDRRISLRSKAVYAYFCTFAGGSNVCFPSKEKICYDLGVSPNSLAKYLKELTDHGFLTITQSRDHGHFSRNIYTLTEPCTENTVNQKMVNQRLHTKNNSVNTNKNYKNNSAFSGKCGIIYNDGADKMKFGEFGNVELTEGELAAIKGRFPDWQARIDHLSAYIAGSGRNYKSHYATLIRWAMEDHRKQRYRKGLRNFSGDDGMNEFEIAELRKRVRKNAEKEN